MIVPVEKSAAWTAARRDTAVIACNSVSSVFLFVCLKKKAIGLLRRREALGAGARRSSRAEMGPLVTICAALIAIVGLQLGDATSRRAVVTETQLDGALWDFKPRAGTSEVPV